MKTEDNCIFCKMRDGKFPVDKLWEDEKFFSFLDIHPINPGHVLLIPKKHLDYLFDLNDNEYKELMTKAKEIAIILKKKLKPRRTRKRSRLTIFLFKAAKTITTLFIIF